MDNWHARTIKTYNESAAQLAEYFSGYGPRINDIERAITCADCGREIRVVEVGCGDGRDAVEIVKRTSEYVGVDPSEGMLRIARGKLPEIDFILSDAISFNYPEGIDVIFAFASILHVRKEDLPKFFGKAYRSLREGGVVLISAKESERYYKKVKADEFGERMFFFYSVGDVVEIAGDLFELVHEEHQVVGKTDWFTIVLKKVSKSWLFRC